LKERTGVVSSARPSGAIARSLERSGFATFGSLPQPPFLFKEGKTET
jgi:hypothetical protein